MSTDTELSVVKKELALYGIKPDVDTTGGNHVRISWQIPGKAKRSMTVANTGSDWRGPLNERANVRRLLREDGLELAIARENGHAKPKAKSLLDQAISVPKESVPLTEQVAALRAEAADLTDAVVDLHKRVGEVNTVVLDVLSVVGEIRFMLKATVKRPPRKARKPVKIRRKRKR